jgi:hypothetical protein
VVEISPGYYYFGGYDMSAKNFCGERGSTEDRSPGLRGRMSAGCSKGYYGAIELNAKKILLYGIIRWLQYIDIHDISTIRSFSNKLL